MTGCARLETNQITRFISRVAGKRRASVWLPFLVFFVALAPGSAPVWAESVIANVPVSGVAPWAVAVNPITNRVYVANSNSANVTVINGATNGTIATVHTGGIPWAIAANPVTNRIYVANSNNGTVTVIDGATNIPNLITAGAGTFSIAVNPVTNKIYAANSGSGTVTVINGANNATSTVVVGGSLHGIAVNQVTNKIYVANQSSNNVAEIDGVTNDVTMIPAGILPYAVAVNPVTNKIYVANQNSDNVTVIDGAAHSAITIPAGNQPYAIAVNPVTNKIYVANLLGNSVTVIDGASNGFQNIAAGAGPIAIEVNPDTNKVFVANNGSPTVTIIDGSTNSVTAITTGGSCGHHDCIGINQDTNRIYVANASHNAVAVLAGPPPVPTLSAITVTPANPAISVGQTQQFTATGTFSDGTSGVLSGDSAWVSRAAMTTPRSSLQGAALNGLLYAVGGNNGVATPIVEAYNPVTNVWSTVAPLNAPNYGGQTGRYEGSAVAVNGKVFMMGGWTNSPALPSNTLSIYDPATNSWSLGPPIPGSGYTGCSESAVIGSKIYLLNACNGYSGYVRQLSIFDTNTYLWTVGPPAPRNHNAGVGAALNGKFYVTGGTDGSYQPQVDVYDPATGSWATVGNMPVNLWGMTGDVINGKWYIIGGSDPTTSYKNTVWIYDPMANTWMSGPPAPTGRTEATAAAINGKLYVVGGFNSTGYLSSLEVFDPNASGLAWSSSNTSAATTNSTGLATGINPGTTTITATVGSISGSATLTVLSPTFTLSISKAGAGRGTVASSPVGISCGGDCTETYNNGASVTLTATPDAGTVFAGWSGGGCAGTGTCTVTMNTTTSVLATFNVQTFALTVTRAGTGNGTITSSPAGINCGTDCAEIYNIGSMVTLTAVPAGGSQFAGWSGDSDCTDGSVMMTAATTCTATFDLVTLTSIAVTPADPTILTGQTQQFTATGTFSDGTSRVLAGGSSTWVGKAPMPTPRYAHAVGVVNGTLYAVGGYNSNSGPLATVEAYDPVTGIWTPRAPMPTPRHGPAVGVVNGTLYAVGGLGLSGHLATVEAYDPMTNTWTSRASMPTPRHSPALGVVNGILYAVGGYNSSGILATVEAYNPATNTWTTIIPMLTPRYEHAVGVVNGTLYVVGGIGLGYLSTVEAYDPTANTWTPRASMPTPRYRHAVGAVNGILYAVGGESSGSILPTVGAYDPATNTWTPRASMPTSRFELATGVVNGTLYAVGGYNGSSYLPTMEAYTPSEVIWSSSNTSAAIISPTGLAIGLSPGSSTITATSGSISGTTILTVMSPNRLPVACAGLDQIIEATGPSGAAVSLNGACSTDPDGDALSYTWNGLFGSVSGINPTVSLPLGTHIVILNVSDGLVSATDAVVITVRDTTPPIVTVPADITAEASGAAGSIVTYASSASDLVDGALVPVCAHASGSTFAIGTTIVTCSASDAAGNTGSASFSVTVQDTTPPVIDPHADVTVEATSAAGAVVSYLSPTTSDAVDGAGVASCTPASGSVFSLGDTTVTCTATDAHGNVAIPTTFVVHVVDTTAPVVIVPGDMIVEATGPSGSVVTFIVSASDLVDGVLTPTCTPASGTTFAIGTATVTCSASDAAGNTGSASFSVTVQDTTPPVIDPHADVTVEATSAAGAVVSYTSPTTSDAVDGAGVASCTPASGSTFALGDATVTCTASDAHGNVATATTFVVHVVDTTPPVISVGQLPLANANGWNNTNVAVSFSATDAVSTPMCTVDSMTLTTEGAAQVVSTTCTDAAGNIASASHTVNIDKTAPAVIATRTPAANASGWNNTDVTAHFSATDGLSGIQGAAAADVLVSTEGMGQTASASFTDLAGNSSSVTVSNINIDKTVPVLLMPSLAGSYGLNSSITLTFGASDALAGLATQSATLNGNPISSGSTVVLTQLGANTFVLTATDQAGNTVTETRQFTVNYAFGGFLSPLGNNRTAFHLGSVIPVKFDLFDANGVAISAAVAHLSLQKLNDGEPVGDPIDATPTSGADSGNLFRYSGGHYMYNLSTKPFSAGIWRIQVTLDDGSVHTIEVGLTSK